MIYKKNYKKSAVSVDFVIPLLILQNNSFYFSVSLNMSVWFIAKKKNISQVIRYIRPMTLHKKKIQDVFMYGYTVCYTKPLNLTYDIFTYYYILWDLLNELMWHDT